MLDKRVLFHDSDPEALSAAQTAILAAGAEPTLTADPAEVERALSAAPEALDAVVVGLGAHARTDAQGAPKTAAKTAARTDEGADEGAGEGAGRWEALLEELERSFPSTRVLLLVRGDIAPYLSWMSQRRVVSHLLAWRDEALDGEQLRVALSKLFTGEVFGLEHYLGRGTAIHQLTVQDSRDKGAYVREVAALATRFGLAPRQVELAETVTDELSTNAIFNAPRDAAGRPRYATLNRREAVALEPHEVAALRFGCDGRTFGISVRDPFGSLTRETVVKYLERCLRQTPAELITETGGAGLGLYRVYGAISRFVINIRPGARTETIGLIDVRRSLKEHKTLPKSLQIYAQEVAT
jgi:hypothetical protein